jgi:hypothetical protein
VIELERDGDALCVRGTTHGTAFVDRAWLAEGPLRAIVVRDDGEVVGADGVTVLDGTTEPAAELGAAAMFALAEAAVRAADAAPPGDLEITGSGLLADTVRRLAAERGREGGASRPSAIVETTGGQQEISGALHRLSDLGILVLAVPPAEPVALDLYADVHVRGLQVVGVGIDPDTMREVIDSRRHESLLDRPPALARDGAPVDPAAAWVEVVA